MTTHFPNGLTDQQAQDLFGTLPILDPGKYNVFDEDFNTWWPNGAAQAITDGAFNYAGTIDGSGDIVPGILIQRGGRITQQTGRGHSRSYRPRSRQPAEDTGRALATRRVPAARGHAPGHAGKSRELDQGTRRSTAHRCAAT